MNIRFIGLIALLFSFNGLGQDGEVITKNSQETLQIASRLWSSLEVNNQYDIALIPCKKERSDWSKTCGFIQTAFNDSNFLVLDNFIGNSPANPRVNIQFSQPKMSLQVLNSIWHFTWEKMGYFYITAEYNARDDHWKQGYQLSLNTRELAQFKNKGLLSCSPKECLMQAGVNLVIQHLSQQQKYGFIPVVVHRKAPNLWWIKKPVQGMDSPKTVQLCYIKNANCLPIGTAELTAQADGTWTFSPTNWNPDSLTPGDWALWPSKTN